MRASDSSHLVDLRSMLPTAWLIRCCASSSSLFACRYVCETMANRVLRFVQKPAGVFHFSVFHQFSGGLGPSGVTCDAKGNVYVGRMDFASAPTEDGVPSSSSPGMVTVLSAGGAVLQETECPASEVSGLVVSGDTLYVSEASTNTVYKMPTL